MKTPLSLILTVAVVLGGTCCLQGEDATVDALVAKLTAETVSAEELKATEASLEQAPPEEVLPLLLPLLSEGMPDGAIFNSGGVERDAGASRDWRMFYSAGRVWGPLARASPELAAKLLVEEFVKKQSSRGRKVLLSMISNQWSKAAEAVVADIVKKWQDNPETWLAAANCLTQNERVKYDKLLIETALAQPEGDWKQQITKAQFLQTLFEYRNKAIFRARKPTDVIPPIDTRLLNAGMNLLKKMEAHKPGMGYFLALSLADYVEEDFKADPDDERFAKGVGGLNELFFVESSQNALRWWNENRSRF